MTETSMMRLGGREFVIRPLTLRQIREIDEALGRIQVGVPTRIDFDAAITILHAALERSQPPITREELLDLEATKPQLVAATRAVLRLSGYLDQESAAPGEERAGH